MPFLVLHLSSFGLIHLHQPKITIIYLHLPSSAFIYLHLPSSIFIYHSLLSDLHLPLYVCLYIPWSIFLLLLFPSLSFSYFHLSSSSFSYYLHLPTSIFIRQKSPFWPSKFQQFLRSMLSIYPSKDFIYSANINPTPLTNPRSALSSELTSCNKISILQVLLYFSWHSLWLIKFYHQRGHSQ